MTSKAIAYEALTLKALREEGWQGTVEQLRELAGYGARLRRRYENTCNYQWATTDDYTAMIERDELYIASLAAKYGLTLYLQTDPRGATVYVRDKSQTIDDNRYNTQAQCLYFERADA